VRPAHVALFVDRRVLAGNDPDAGRLELLLRLDIVELVMAMEEEFEVEIPDEEAENIKSVGDAINYINTHKK